MGENRQTASVRQSPWPHLRQATLILPKTGERVKRNFTLRDPALHNDGETSNGAVDDEQTPLLPTRKKSNPTTYFRAIYSSVLFGANRVKIFVASPTGQGVLKCSLAYLLGSMATLVMPVAGLLGQQDGKHMVATVTVYFHPARSAGSMHQATLLALLAFVYAAFIGFTSMGVSAFFASQDMLAVGHVIVLVVFCGGGLGLVGWIKQALGHPLVNVACSLASLAIVTVLTKEGAVQDGVFSDDKITQVLKMVIMGIVITTVVNLTVKPISARRELRQSLIKTTDAMGLMLAVITHSFLSGSDDELRHPLTVAASERFKTVYGSLTGHLSEAKYEHFILGRENQYHHDARLVMCMQRLAQDIGGLRSALATQINLLSESGSKGPNTPRIASASTGLPRVLDIAKKGGATPTLETHEEEEQSNPSTNLQYPPIGNALRSDGSNVTISASSPTATFSTSLQRTPTGNALRSDGSNVTISASSPTTIFSTSLQYTPTGNALRSDGSNVTISASSPTDIFSTFLIHLGPPMKSLAYTLKQILDELPSASRSTENISVHQNFKTSLQDAVTLFSRSRKEALELVYMSKALSRQQSIGIAADFEDVATSCGYFSSSLQDFAENTLIFLDVLYDLERELEERPGGRTWNWLHVWQYGRRRRRSSVMIDQSSHIPEAEHEEYHIAQDMPGLGVPPKDRIENLAGTSKLSPSTSQVWSHLKFLRRNDIRFAIKVGAGAAFYAMFSFIANTQPIYSHWRLEWGLVSYMVVCSMTIGASNTTGINRIIGTCAGAAFAVIAWIISDTNPYSLAVFGWLVSLWCFYLIIGKGQGPMGRFILLTYNLSCLYAYSLSVKDEEGDEDEGGINPQIWEIVKHRVVAVLLGCLWGVIITRMIWPISARKKVRDGLSLLWLRMGLTWKRGPLSILVDNSIPDRYSIIREETLLRQVFTRLETLNKSAGSEIELRGPFPVNAYKKLLASTSNMLDSSHALDVLITKDLKASPGEKKLLEYTKEEREQLGRRISHIFSVLASSIKLEYSLSDAMPKVDSLRDRLLAKVFDFRQNGNADHTAADEDYELLYAYSLVTGQISNEMAIVAEVIDEVYGSMDEDLLKLQ